MSAGDNVHAAACLGMADVYLFMAENQDIYERANWFSFNRVLNAMVVVGDDREPVYPLQKRGYLSTYEIIQDVFRDAKMLNGTVMSSSQLTVSLGSVNAVNARATANEFGETKVVAVNLTDKSVTFELKFDDVVYSRSFKHEALVFDNLGVVAPIDYFSDPLQLIKEGTGTITLPPLSVSKISGIYYDESIKLIAGTIEAEDYKAGGEGVGYSDTTTDNTLSTGIDTEGVDVGTDNGITYVGDTQNGEWLKYDINVLEANDYDFEFIAASQSPNAMVSVEIDDAIIFDNFALPQTSNATDFQSFTNLTIPLTKGLHELKLNIQNGGFNLDKINVNEAPTIEPPSFVTPNNLDNIEIGGRIEVEASTTSAPENIASLELYINNVLVRSITSVPFTWGYSGQGDTLLENMVEGTYELKLLLTDNRGRTRENSIIVTSTGYPTRPFSGIAHSIPGIIQTEDYDFGGSGLAFFDSTTGNSGGVYRTESGEDVDIINAGTGFAISSLTGNEYVRYTVNVTESGSYEMLVNYRTFSNTSKPFATYILPKDLSSSELLFSAPSGSTTEGIRKITEGGIFQDYTSNEFDLESGLWVLELKIPNGGAGPNYDYVTFNRLGSLSIGQINETQNELKIHPIPSKDGIFNLSISSSWEVYSVLGTKIAEGSGNLINISNFSKGIYILKTDKKTIRRLFYN